MIPKEYYADSLVRIPLHGENGTDFAATLYLKETVVPDVIVFKFTEQHYLNDVITYEDLKTLIAGVVSIFDADYAMLFNHEIDHIEGRTKWVNGPDRKFLRKLGWFTYFGPSFVDFLGRRRFKSLRSVAEKYELHGGIMVILQEEPLQNEPKHLARLRQAEAEMRLHKLS
ncbi:MAG: hypothetical protein JXJ17_18355 [Anaerolineae bacterium]|nr:hypothetical protein [Anaerolineae bacterium]